MPNNIDERIVEMRIDNQQFVKGANKTISVLDKLKTALNFKEQTNELNDFENSIRNVDFSGLSDAIEIIGDRFTVLGIMGKRAIENIADSIYNFSVRTLKSLSFDQIISGYSKYEQKMKSVQTMMAATASQIGTAYANQEEQLEAINEQMDRLNFFTDETSYDFTGMSNNMASFISAGVGLRDARIDMQGVAAAAGIAGASVEQANHAMNNLSQAIAMGSLKVQDWQSLETAKITTDEFKKVVAETAVECGKLTKVGDNLYETIATGSQKAIRFSSEGIRTALSTGFVDREVIERTLHKYGEFSDVLNTISDKTGVTATDLLQALELYEKGELDFAEFQVEISDYIREDEIPSIAALEEAFKELSDEQLDLGKRAFKASQEYNSFRDAINATKDAVSTGWMTTFEYIFGDYMEARKVWTAIGDELYEIFAAGKDRRNAIMAIWHDDPGGRAAFLESIRNVFDAFMSLIEPVKRAFNDIFKIGDSVDDAAGKIIDLTTRFRDFTETLGLSEEKIEKLRSIFRTIFDVVSKIGKAAFDGVVEFFKEIKRLAAPVINAIERVFPVEKFSSVSDFISKIISDIGDFLSKIKLSDKALLGLENVVAGILTYLKNLFNTANESVFSKILSFIKNMIELGARLINVFFESFADGFDGKTILTAISNVFHEIGDTAGNVWDILARVIGGIIGFIDKIRDWFKNFQGIGETIKKIFGFIKTVIDSIAAGLKEAFGEENLGSNIIKIAAAIGLVIRAIFAGRDAIWTIKNKLKPLKELINSISGAFDSLGEMFAAKKWESYGKVFKDFGLSILMVAAALWILAAIDINKLGGAVNNLIVIMMALATVMGLLNKYGGKGLNATLLGAGILEIASAMLVLALSLALLSILDPENLSHSLNALLTTLFALAIVSGLLSKYAKGGNFALLGFGLLELASAIFILSAALALLSLADPNKLSSALDKMVISLVAIAVVAGLLSKYASGGNLALVGFGLMEIAVGMFILAAALTMMSLADPDKLATSMLILGVTLMAIAVVSQAMSPLLPLIGLGLVLVSIAIALLAAALIALTLVDPIKLGDALLILVGALLALIVVMAAMQYVALGALALLAVGLAMAIAAAGILVLAIALKMMQGLDLLSMADGLSVLGLALIILALGLAAMTVGLVGAVALIAAAGGLILLATGLNLLVGMNLAEMADGITLLGISLIFLGLGGVAMLAGSPGLILGAMAITLFGLALYPFTAGLKQLEQISWDDILKYLAALGGSAVILAALTPVLGPLALAVTAFGVACAAAGAGVYMAGEGMEKIANSLTTIPDQAKGALLSIVEQMSYVIGEIKPKGEEAVTAISDVCYAMVQAVSSGGIDIFNAYNRMINNCITLLNNVAETFKTLGGNLDAGIANGIYERINDPVEAMHWLAYEMSRQFMSDFQINSPSRLMEKLTSYIPIGAAQGLESTADVANEAMQDMGSQMLAAIYPSLQALQLLLDEEYDFTPTITPIVDMSNVDSSANAVKNLLSSADMTANINARNIDAMVSNAGRITEEMNAMTAGQVSNGDSFVINVYSQPGMDENDLANAVMYKIQNGILRKGAALG